MNKRTTKTTMGNSNKRLLSIEEASDYLSLGTHSTREWCSSLGAIVKIGGRVLVDKYRLDACIDEIRQTKQ